MKNIRISFVIFFTAILAIVPVSKVYGQNFLNLYYYTEDNNFEELVMIFPSKIKTEDKIKFMYYYFFSNAPARFFAPESVEVLDVKIIEDRLELNVSKDILNIKGEYTERILSEQLIKTAISIPGISEFVLLVDGNDQVLPDGTVIVYP